MNSKLLAIIGFLLFAGPVIAEPDEYSEYVENKNDETQSVEKEETNDDEQAKLILEDMNTETSTALVQNDDPDYIKHKGLCHYGVAVWFKPGATVRCSCLKCTCRTGGNWACAYEFAYCPYFYCGNKIYNPKTQVCCCGKAYDKKASHACCGYFYYDKRYSQCCNYFSVKSKKAKCPRYQI